MYYLLVKKKNNEIKLKFEYYYHKGGGQRIGDSERLRPQDWISFRIYKPGNLADCENAPIASNTYGALVSDRKPRSSQHRFLLWEANSLIPHRN